MAEIAFTAYAGDCLVYARLELPTGRLTDYLNERDGLALSEVVMQSHEDGRLVEVAHLELDMADVYAVDARGSRGTPERRIRTRTARMEIELGSYRVLGQVHAPPGADPLAMMVRRKPMIPITDATIAFTLAGEARLRDVQALIVNRRLIEGVHPALDPTAKLQALAVALDPRVKDLTGLIYS